MAESDCPFCAAVGGTCHPHRTGVLRLLERSDLYGPTILAWGADGGPKGVRAVRPATRGLSPTEVAADRHAIYERFGRRERWRVPADCAVLCAVDAGQFVPLQLMLASLLLSHDVAVTVVDLGLTAPQRAWLDRQPVAVAEPPDGPMPPDVEMWQSWNKPAYFGLTAARRVLWLDNDIVVDGDLRPLFAAIESGPVLVRDYFASDPTIILNREALYGRFPVPARLDSLNAGIVGVDPVRDRSLLAAWRFLAASAAADPDLRASIAWYDQGCLLWAAESLGVDVLDRPEWNTAGRSPAQFAVTFDRPSALLATLPRDKAAIWHFPGRPKPYAWGEVPLSLRPAPDLSVYVLGHEPFSRPEREWITPLNLSERDPDNGWAESRAFEQVRAEDIPTEYVGLASVSWVRKYDGMGVWSPWEFGELDLSPSVVWIALATTDQTWVKSTDWVDHMENASPGIRRYIEEMRAVSGLVEVQPSGWSNNYVMHKDVYRDLAAFVRRMKAHFLAAYPDGCPYTAQDPRRPWGYLAEGFSIHYLASRGDLTLKEMRRPGCERPAPRQIDRSKPRMQLGQNQRPRQGCVSCAEQAAARIAAAKSPG